MEFTVSARHMEVTESMGRHIAEHVDKLPRLDGHITRLTVTLSKDSSSEQVEIIVNVSYIVNVVRELRPPRFAGGFLGLAIAPVPPLPDFRRRGALLFILE